MTYWGTGYTVYKHTNRVNGKVYIGQTKKRNLTRRWCGGHGYKECRYMFSAIVRYGWLSFDHEILETGLTKEEAFEREAYYIKKYKSNDARYGYNIREDGSPKTFSKEGMKSLVESNTGANNNVAVPVTVFDLNGIRLETFPTMKEACQYTGVSPGYMSQKCQRASGTVGMYICRYASDVEGIDVLPPEMIYKPREMRHCWVKVACYDLDGNYLKSFDSLSKAVSELGLSSTSLISGCLVGTQKSAGGYMWAYDNGNRPDKLPPLRSIKRTRGIAICKYDRFTGKKIETYSSISAAAEYHGCTITLIKRALEGKLRTAVNYIWKYESDHIDSVTPIPVRGGRYDRS